MFTVNTIIKEINDLPPDKLDEVYDFVHSLKFSSKHKEKSSKKIHSFAGAFSDMDQKQYADLKAQTSKTRTLLFDRNIDI